MSRPLFTIARNMQRNRKSRHANSRFVAFLRLARPALAPTAAADVLAGYALLLCVDPFSRKPLGSTFFGVLFIALASVFLYSAGMVLNDFFDSERDGRLRPDRPIPSGAVSPRAALIFAMALAAAGLLSAMAADTVLGGTAAYLAGMLFFAILIYDGGLKAWAIPGALALGLCRGINMLMGMAAHGSFRDLPATDPPGWHHLLLIALALAAFTAVLTWVSTHEERGMDRVSLAAAAVLWLAVLIGAGFLSPVKVLYARAAALAAAGLILAAAGSAVWRDGRSVRRLVSAGLVCVPIVDLAFVAGLGMKKDVVPLWPFAVAVGACALWTLAVWAKRTLT
jgi:4-hydroxybenzoate polyprenyltransferase